MELEHPAVGNLAEYSGLNLFFRAEHLIKNKHPHRDQILRYVLHREKDSGLFL